MRLSQGPVPIVTTKIKDSWLVRTEVYGAASYLK